MKPLFLIGYMGCGKSTMGRTVGRMTGRQFIDLDHYIEARYCKTVKDIFAEKGEDGFRKIERQMLHEVGAFEDVIVACGGGTPCFFDNMEYMNGCGRTVFLDASLEKLHSRLMRGRHKRPLIAGKNDEELRTFIIEALEARRPFYERASDRFEADLLENECEIGETAGRFIRQFGLDSKQSDDEK